MKYSKHRNTHSRKNRHTRKKYPIQNQLFGNIIHKKEGWISIHIYGESYQRGFAHGVLLSNEMKPIMRAFPYIVESSFKVSFEKYLNVCNEKTKPIVMNDYPELYEEIRGISNGFLSVGVEASVDYLIAWNSLLSMYSYFRNNKAYKCSAFIATGNATEDGKIVMAHNTHADFIIGQIQNVVIYVTPMAGNPFVMQSAPGYVASGTDWFICSTGIIGCETTISNINYIPQFGAPFFCRIRQAMQYGKTLDEYVEIMLKDNAGDYACSWQFGDINTNEIMLFEIGLKTHAIQRTFNGVYYGMNSAIDFKVRSIETNDKDLYNLEKSSGSRNFRLNQLLNETYYGKINIHNAKKVLSDHYDPFLHKNNMNSRTICKHSENDPGKFTGKPYYPFGCTDGKVVDSSMAKKLSFIGRFGSCCGRAFKASSHIKKHPQYKNMKDILQDLPKKNWTILSN
jgi:hypothetical protein